MEYIKNLVRGVVGQPRRCDEHKLSVNGNINERVDYVKVRFFVEDLVPDIANTFGAKLIDEILYQTR